MSILNPPERKPFVLGKLASKAIKKLFHGAVADFDSFNSDFAQETAFGKGFSFTPEKKIAEGYANITPKEVKKLWGKDYVEKALKRKEGGTPILYEVEANIEPGELLLSGKNFLNQNKKIQDKINKLIKEENIDRESLNLDSAKFWRQLLKITGKNADELFSKYKIKAILKDARGSSLEDIVVGGKVEYTVFDPKSLNIVNKKFLNKGKDMPRDKKWLGSYIKKYKPHLKKKKAAKKTNTASTNNQTSGSGQQGEADTSYVPKQTLANIETLLAKPRIKFNEGSESSESSESSYVRLALQYEKELERAKTPEARQQVRKNYNKIMGNFSNEERVEGQKQLEIMRREEPMAKMNEGSLMVPPEMPLNMEASEIPVDTYTPEDQANAEETQLPDDVMEEEHIDFVVSESLLPEEQDYLVNALEADPQLSQIFDKVVSTASEFTGSGEVEGPGTGVSDSIPARLSDGEFVMTRKATDQIGADNLQRMMDDAERAYDGGLQKMNLGGYMEPEETEVEESTDDEVERLMMASNRIPSVR